jgi:hypothetical protein
MANRLAFDIGLHLDCRGDNIPEQEIQIRHQVMRACVLYDKYWALFLGRPTSIKSQDIGMDLLSKRFSMLASAPSAFDGSRRTTSKATDTEVHEQLIELMEIAGKIVETRDHHKLNFSFESSTHMFGSSETEDNAYMQVISLDRQLQNWYRRLPDHLTWKPVNIKAAPFPFFLLHQQYHVSMILLHRPWAKYGSITSSDGSSTNSHPSPSSTTHQAQTSQADHSLSLSNLSGGNSTSTIPLSSHTLGLGDPQSLVDDSRTSLSRSICTQQAIRVARIFWQHRQRFSSRRICVTGIQHAGTSAIALIAALAYQTSQPDRRSYLSYLEILSAAIADMAHTYQPAARMDDLLKAILVQLRSDVDDSTTFRASAMLNHFHPAVATTGHALTTGGGGASVMFSPTAGWNASPDNIYSILPQRRENPSSLLTSSATAAAGATEGPASKKQRRPGALGRRASEFSRPPPPFFNHNNNNNAKGGPGPTPPGSSGSFGVLPQHHHAASMSISMGPPTTGLFDGSNGFGLDFLSGSAVDFEGGPEDGGQQNGGPGNGEDYVLVTPSSDGWGLGGGGGSGGGGGGGMDGHTGYEVSMSEWMSNGTGASAAATGLGGNVGKGAAKGGAEQGAAGLSASLGSHPGDSSAKADGGLTEGSGGMEWMGSEGGMNALSPVSLSGLVQSVEEAAGGNDGSANAGRNHELDFFSF